jgi:hypothetical protein
MKSHKEAPEYTITKDDAELVTERVQDRIVEEYEEEEEQRERIMQELTEVRHILEKIRMTKAQNEETTQQQTMQREGTTVQITTTTSETFNITKDMLRVDEDVAQTQLKDVEQLELVLERIPTKALYKLQVSVVHEVQSRARMDATDLETTREAKEVLETVLTEVRLEQEEEKQCAERLEKRLEEVFQTILDSALAGEINAEEKLKKIVQTMEEYKQEISRIGWKNNTNHTSRGHIRKGGEIHRTNNSYCTGS